MSRWDNPEEFEQNRYVLEGIHEAAMRDIRKYAGQRPEDQPKTVSEGLLTVSPDIPSIRVTEVLNLGTGSQAEVPPPAMTDTEILDWLLDGPWIDYWWYDDEGSMLHSIPTTREEVIAIIRTQLLQNQKRGAS